MCLLITAVLKKVCPTRPYATMWRGIMGNGGSWVLDCVFRCFCDKERNGTNRCRSVFFPLLLTAVNLNQVPIYIVAYAFMLLWDNLCLNSCKYRAGFQVAGYFRNKAFDSSSRRSCIPELYVQYHH